MFINIFKIFGRSTKASPEKSQNTFQQFFADLKNPKDLYGSIRPLLLLTFLFGISPFRTVGSPGNRHLKLTFAGIANTLFLFALFTTSFVQRVSNNRSFIEHFSKTKVSRFAEDLQILTSFTGFAITLILCFLKRNKLRKLFQVLNRIDKKLIHLGAIFNYKRLSRIVLLALFVAFFFYSVFICMSTILVNSFAEQPDFYEWVCFILPIAIVSMLKLQFYCVMQLLKYRLRFINLILNNLQREQIIQHTFENVDRNKIYTCDGIKCNAQKLRGGVGNRRDKYAIIAELCRAHEDICDACYVAEELFSHQMLTAVAIDFLSALFNVYFIFEIAYNNAQNARIDQIEYICFSAFYSTISLGTVYALLVSAEAVTTEVSCHPFFF